MPERMLAWDGSVVGLWAKAHSNRTPLAARASIAGVGA